VIDSLQVPELYARPHFENHGDPTWSFDLTNPRGVFRAGVFIDTGNDEKLTTETVKTVEVK
jgi:hypothetical protein